MLLKNHTEKRKREKGTFTYKTGIFIVCSTLLLKMLKFRTPSQDSFSVWHTRHVRKLTRILLHKSIHINGAYESISQIVVM